MPDAAFLTTTDHRSRLLRQRLDARQLLAFEKFERSSAAGGDVRDLVRYAGLVDGATESPPPMIDVAALLAATALAIALVPTAKLRKFEDARRAVPDDRLGLRDHFSNGCDRSSARCRGPASRPGKSFDASHTCVLASGANLSARTLSTGSSSSHALGLGLVERLPWPVSILSSSTSDLAVVTPSAR